MSELDVKVENYIINNIKNGTAKKFREIIDEFAKQGFTKEEVLNSLKAFNKNHCSHNTDILD